MTMLEMYRNTLQHAQQQHVQCLHALWSHRTKSAENLPQQRTHGLLTGPHVADIKTTSHARLAAAGPR